jgi:ribosomal protein S18 acetylase RimI-like enzyme
MLLRLANPPGAYELRLNLVWENFCMSDEADRAAHALIAVFRVLASMVPGMYEQQACPGVFTLVSGLPVATLNGVCTDVVHPDVTAIDRAAAGVAALGLPWSIQFRGEPEPAAGRVAARYGLTGRHTSPLMVYDLAANPMPPSASEAAAARVTTAGPADYDDYAAALAAGFEAPREIMARFGSAAALEMPGAAGYLAREDGRVAAVGFGVFLERTCGIYNIATVPEYRRRGYGRAVSSRIMADGIERGADLAYLQSTADGLPLYESMGFRTVETWTYLI